MEKPKRALFTSPGVQMSEDPLGEVSKANKATKTGVLLVNLGTPGSQQPKDVRRYLIEFLTDARVIDLPWLRRQLLVRGVIVPLRYRSSAKAYAAIWTEKGSPLLVHGEEVREALQDKLGPGSVVALAMRYQNPSIAKALQLLLRSNISHLLILPLFPQYASATTGSIYEKIMTLLAAELTLPKLTFIDNFATHPRFIDAIAERAAAYELASYDHILISFHGLPKRHLERGDRNGCCLKSELCCSELSSKNNACYSAQCFATARALAEKLQLPSERYTVCFQSRLGKDPWLTPYASEIITRRAKLGTKRLLVFCPSFVCDCLETLYEFGIEYAEEFRRHGGEQLDLVEGLNSSPTWISAIKEILSG